MRTFRTIPLVALLLLAAVGPLPAAGQALPDFDAARDEAVSLLQDLVRINTTSPPGNETEVAEYVKEVLAREGIDGQIFAKDPKRGNLVARLPGNGSKEPILILAHSDVVGAELESWTGDPFAGTIEDGYVYGRGASDDKDMVAAALQVMLMVKRSGRVLDRDIILLIEAGEEGATEFGIDYMVENHLDKIRAEFALNEGGTIHQAEDGSVDYVVVGATEKVPWRQIKLVARGTAGHGSQPRLDNPVVHIAAAVAKLGDFQMPMRLNEVTREYFKRLAEISPPEKAELYRNIENPARRAQIEEEFRRSDIAANSTLRTSISPNIIQGGFRYNVIPSDAEATLDVRALPDEDMDAFLEELRRVIDDPLVEVLPPVSWRPAAPPSSLGTDLFRALEGAQGRLFPDAVTLPTMGTGATDSAQLRAAGIPTYGIGAMARDEDSRAHGNDERVSIEGLGTFVEYIYWTVMEVAGRPAS
ncbi:MAG: M20/M25/M40 family metallo-hydrolase [Gemmatimonadota bacterium]